MSDIFISYARSTEAAGAAVAEALRALGYGVWRDDELPAHRAYADVIEERLKAAKAVVVIWSAEAVKSEWVRRRPTAPARTDKLVQLNVDGVAPAHAVRPHPVRRPRRLERAMRTPPAGGRSSPASPSWSGGAPAAGRAVRRPPRPRIASASASCRSPT